jgi:hypothetical protein
MKAKTTQYAEFEIFVSLRTIDRVALTARQTLTDRLGFGGILTGLQRADYYRLAITGEEPEGLSYARDLLVNTTVFANPTKETANVAAVKRPLSDLRRRVVLIYPRDGLFQENLLKRLAFDLGYDRVLAAGRGVAWTLELAPGADKKYVEDIVVARARDRGLLMNPHAEAYEML